MAARNEPRMLLGLVWGMLFWGTAHLIILWAHGGRVTLVLGDERWWEVPAFATSLFIVTVMAFRRRR